MNEIRNGRENEFRRSVVPVARTSPSITAKGRLLTASSATVFGPQASNQVVLTRHRARVDHTLRNLYFASRYGWMKVEDRFRKRYLEVGKDDTFKRVAKISMKN